MTKKGKANQAGRVKVGDTSAKERNAIQKRIKKREHRLRKKYPEIRGKVVDWINHWTEEGLLFFCVQFKDGTNFAVCCSHTYVLHSVDLTDRSSGDEVFIKDYYSRRED